MKNPSIEYRAGRASVGVSLLMEKYGLPADEDRDYEIAKTVLECDDSRKACHQLNVNLDETNQPNSVLSVIRHFSK
ncbi:hypothetical protein [Alterisphingorhabdus coralli]|uniref:Uncharacterized protein n=1 Tax=Alterisphingorhabdus coralli TaxID=3071408 RepID=A0AA97F8J6_9SPHN|nr:hypothetical protein [Parasphingorhabdus sp. SCSIO 66989]WOE76344.1 hypothetical protein RB602_06425 [Parasphingorhabdus sp. SCSIO 66989]